MAQIKAFREDAIPLSRGTPMSCGWDVSSPDDHFILTNSRKLIKIGWQIACPEGYYARIAPRSGMALAGLDIAGGVVDPDYQGEIGVILVNNSSSDVSIKRGQRIAQIILEKYCADALIILSCLTFPSQDRGTGGFGSTGE